MNCQPTTEQKQRRARKMKAPVQLDLPLDLAAAVTASIARFEVPPAPPPAPVAQSPRAAKVAAETTMQAEARRTLAKKAERAAKPKLAKPRVRTTKP